jgi:hypothetical protein
MRLTVNAVVYNGKSTITTLKSHFSHCLNCLESLMREDSTPKMADIGPAWERLISAVRGEWHLKFPMRNLSLKLTKFYHISSCHHNKITYPVAITVSCGSTSYPGSFLFERKDRGRRWSRDLLKSSRFLINYLGFLHDNHTKCKL